MEDECRFAKHTAAQEKQESSSVTGAKRKAPAEDAEAASGAVGDGGEDAAHAEIKFVEMPKELLAWILSQERETSPPKFSYLYSEGTERDREAISKLQASFQATQPAADEFYEFQAWVRDKYKKNGRVMVPEDFLR